MRISIGIYNLDGTFKDYLNNLAKNKTEYKKFQVKLLRNKKQPLKIVLNEIEYILKYVEP